MIQTFVWYDRMVRFWQKLIQSRALCVHRKVLSHLYINCAYLFLSSKNKMLPVRNSSIKCAYSTTPWTFVWYDRMVRFWQKLIQSRALCVHRKVLSHLYINCAYLFLSSKNKMLPVRNSSIKCAYSTTPWTFVWYDRMVRFWRKWTLSRGLGMRYRCMLGDSLAHWPVPCVRHRQRK